MIHFKSFNTFKVLRVCQGKFDLSSTFDVSNKDDILKTLGNMGVDVFHIRPPSSLFTKRSNEKMMVRTLSIVKGNKSFNLVWSKCGSQ